MRNIFNTVLLGILLVPDTLWAHGSHGSGIVAGLSHPVFGIDHLLVILSVSIISHTLLYEKKWLLPILFILSMILGGFLGIGVDPLNASEWVIMGSVIASGIILAFQLEFTLVGFALMAIIIGFFHGHAHGTEIPDESNSYLYVLGFTASAVALSLIGYGIQRITKETLHIRLLGAFIAGIGGMALLQSITLS